MIKYTINFVETLLEFYTTKLRPKRVGILLMSKFDLLTPEGFRSDGRLPNEVRDITDVVLGHVRGANG